MEPRDRFAVNLRKARQSKQISQEELGFRCELHRTEISLLERGGREPRLGTIVKLAGAEALAQGSDRRGLIGGRGIGGIEHELGQDTNIAV